MCTFSEEEMSQNIRFTRLYPQEMSHTIAAVACSAKLKAAMAFTTLFVRENLNCFRRSAIIVHSFLMFVMFRCRLPLKFIFSKWIQFSISIYFVVGILGMMELMQN